MPTIIKVRQNGSYLVDGDDVKVIDWNGNEYIPKKRPFALCRCGHSTTKPFCDGTHTKIGFQAAEDALGPAAADRPADAPAQGAVAPSGTGTEPGRGSGPGETR
jgi:CDGSH-type Zn-finger protein